MPYIARWLAQTLACSTAAPPAVSDATVVGAFADRVDARVVGLHRVVDRDAAVAVNARGFGQRSVRADAAAITTRSAGMVSPSLNELRRPGPTRRQSSSAVNLGSRN